jgi:hypothetical protein
MPIFDKYHFIMPGYSTKNKNEAEQSDDRKYPVIFPAPFQPAVRFLLFGFYKIMKTVYKHGTEKNQ